MKITIPILIAVLLIGCKSTAPVGTYRHTNYFIELLRTSDSLNVKQWLVSTQPQDAIYPRYDSIIVEIHYDSTFVYSYYHSGKFDWDFDSNNHKVFYHPGKKEQLGHKIKGRWHVTKDTLVCINPDYTYRYGAEGVEDSSNTMKYLFKRKKLISLIEGITQAPTKKQKSKNYLADWNDNLAKERIPYYKWTEFERLLPTKK